MATVRPARSAEARARASAVPTAELARRRLAGEATPGPRLAAQGALRLGTPVEHRGDLYALLMGGSWARLCGAIALAYLLLNALFAGLYLLEEGSIQNAAPGSFADSFFFSVQTFATIGYGGMTPRTPYANVLVTVEAAVGLLTTALATGLMVAKAARPRSAALFSDCMVVTPRNGVPTLMFRVGNARGNDIVDASVTVVALLEEITAEGEHLRRLVDIPLARGRTPVFGLTWTVVHPLDESSPLRDEDFSGGAARQLHRDAHRPRRHLRADHLRAKVLCALGREGRPPLRGRHEPAPGRADGDRLRPLPRNGAPEHMTALVRPMFSRLSFPVLPGGGAA